MAKYTVLVMLLLMSCNYKNRQETGTSTKEAWMTDNFIDSVQILLTNDYKINGSSSFGASAFLIEAPRGTFICTAKHLLGEAMGIVPEISTDSFNVLPKYWELYPRNPKLSSDTLRVHKLINEEINDKDIVLFSGYFPQNHKIQALKPRYKGLTFGELVYIIGCEYADTDCHQRKYPAAVIDYEEGEFLIEAKGNFSLSGFSGAPVIDKNGYVIGVVSAGIEDDGVLYILLEPIFSVKKWLEK